METKQNQTVKKKEGRTRQWMKGCYELWLYYMNSEFKVLKFTLSLPLFKLMHLLGKSRLYS